MKTSKHWTLRKRLELIVQLSNKIINAMNKNNTSISHSVLYKQINEIHALSSADAQALDWTIQ